MNYLDSLETHHDKSQSPVTKGYLSRVQSEHITLPGGGVSEGGILNQKSVASSIRNQILSAWFVSDGGGEGGPKWVLPVWCSFTYLRIIFIPASICFYLLKC